MSDTIVIDKDLRTIALPQNFVFGVYNDKDTHRLRFSVPRYYGEFDLSEFTIRINYRNASGIDDQYQVSDINATDDSISFSWLVGSSAYISEGTVTFAICFIKLKENGAVEKEFNTTTRDVTVLEGIEAEPLDSSERYDLLTLMNNSRDEMLAAKDSIKESEENAKNSSTLAKSYAIGGTSTREGEDTDNAKYYADLAAQRVITTIRPMGTITFENLPKDSDATSGDMYNISNSFTTTDSFKEGAGVLYSAGTNIYRTNDGFWDVLVGPVIVGVKGANETDYRTGNVTLTPNDLGAVPTTRTINGKALSSNIEITSYDTGSVPTNRTVNGKPLSTDISLTYDDIEGAPPTTNEATSEQITAMLKSLGIE